MGFIYIILSIVNILNLRSDEKRIKEINRYTEILLKQNEILTEQNLILKKRINDKI